MWFPMSIFFTRRLHQKNTGGSFSCSWDSQNSLFRIEEEWRTKTITFARGWECRATTRWLQDVASICRFSITYLEWSCDRLLFFFWVVHHQKSAVWRTVTGQEQLLCEAPQHGRRCFRPRSGLERFAAVCCTRGSQLSSGCPYSVHRLYLLEGLFSPPKTKCCWVANPPGRWQVWWPMVR